MDDVALTTEDIKDLEHQLNIMNMKKSQEKTMFVTNIDTTENIR